MQAGEELTDSHYLVPENYPSMMPFINVTAPSNPFYHNLHMNTQYQEINNQSTYFRSNSTSDEADEQQLSLINERKQRRMISNRESARRSRMRKQKHLDELWSQVVWLRNEHNQLVDKLNKMSGTHDLVVLENAKLKEEASELREMVTKLQVNGTYPCLMDLDDIQSNAAAYLRAESSNPSISSSSEFF